MRKGFLSFLKNAIIYFSIILILLSSFVFVGNDVLIVQAETTLYNFVDQAFYAIWSSGAGVLQFLGRASDSKEFARYVNNVVLEDGTMWNKVLETYPQWISNGWIMGKYPSEARIEFIQLADLIVTDVLQKDNNVGEKVSEKESSLEEIWYVEEKLPDFIIKDILLKNNRIGYTLANIGENTSIPGHYTTLYIDGKEITHDLVNVYLKPGEVYKSFFKEYELPSYYNITVKVCADNYNKIKEKNEQNNCFEKIFFREEALPDLTVSIIKCNRNSSQIGYVIKNIGKEIAEGGHTTILYVDGKEVDYDIVSVDLKPGETYESWFKKYEWPECQNITAKVCADYYNQVKELNENNNCVEKKCISYPITISITFGPNAANITQESAIIVWTTNKKSDSLVVYIDRATGKGEKVYDPNLVKDHKIILRGLKPMTTYRFYIESKDQCGNTAVSGRIFETLSPPDDESPSVSLILPERLVGDVEILAEASDNVGVEGVIFLIDGVVKLTDFSPPYIWSCDTALFTNGKHNFTAKAFDGAGNEGIDIKEGNIDNPLPDTVPPTITIINPRDGEYVRDLVNIEAFIRDEEYHRIPAGHIREAELYINDVLMKRWTYTPLQYDFFRKEFVFNPPTSDLSFTYLWNTTGLEPNSEYLIEIRACDDSGNEGRASIKVKILKIEIPSLFVEEIKIINVEITRNVVRYGNWFDVYLTIRNTGNVALKHFFIMDHCRGFQAIALPSPLTSQDTRVKYEIFGDLRWSEIRIVPLMETLHIGESWTFHYYAVPILFNRPPLSDDEYVIGYGDYNWIGFEAEGHRQSIFFELPYIPAYMDADENGINDLSDALKCVDYLIITCPVALSTYSPGDREGVNILLQEAAILAKAKSGVLGYITTLTSVEEIKDLIRPGGSWASKLGPSFNHPDTMDAYILIIGEIEIVRSYFWDVWDLDIRWHDGDRQQTVRFSDNYIADVVGDDRPDLIVGRIIGETVRNLTKPIQASIDVYLGNGFDRELGVVVTGYEDEHYHIMEKAEDAANDLSSQGIPHTIAIHWSDFVKIRWHFHFTEYDAYILSDINGDGIDEVIIANDEESKIYIYNPITGRLIRDFSCRFTRYDGLTAGDVDGDGVSEIIIANDEDDQLYIYGPNGMLKTSLQVTFNQWDQIATGEVMETYGEVNLGWSRRDDILIVHKDGDYVSIYTLVPEDETNSYCLDTFSLGLDFTRYDSFAVGNVRDDWEGDEIVIIRDDDEKIYIYKLDSSYFSITHVSCSEIRDLNRDRSKHVRYTPYDGFAIGDVDGNGHDDMIVICDEDKKIYRYYWNGTDWCYSGMYSRLIENWFEGLRYTGRPTRHDGFAVGKVILGENPKITIIRKDGGRIYNFYILASTWNEADEWANQRLTPPISILVVKGHGSPYGPSPMGIEWRRLWTFPKHAFVLSLSCLTGNYEEPEDLSGVHTSFGEALFDSGAAVFIGSTEVSAIHQNNEVLRNYFEHWDIWSTNAGRAFRDYERSVFHDSRIWKLWVYEYNYYGDPKFP